MHLPDACAPTQWAGRDGQLAMLVAALAGFRAARFRWLRDRGKIATSPRTELRLYGRKEAERDCQQGRQSQRRKFRKTIPGALPRLAAKTVTACGPRSAASRRTVNSRRKLAAKAASTATAGVSLARPNAGSPAPCGALFPASPRSLIGFGSYLRFEIDRVEPFALYIVQRHRQDLGISVDTPDAVELQSIKR